MKNIGTIIAALVLVTVLLLYWCTYEVRFTEVAILKTMGKPAENAVTDPGLHYKWPWPIQSVVVYDKRTRILEDRTEETRTIDGKTLLLTTFTLWRISDPERFHTNFPTGVEDAEKKLRTTIGTHKLAVVGRREFSEFVSTDPKERKIRDIESAIQKVVAADARAEYGIEIVDFGIKRLGLPTSVTTAIFQSMRSREEAKSARYVAEGAATAAKIVAEAKAREARIMAEARARAKQIETEAERVVSEYYKEFSEYPELRIFLDKLRTVSAALRARTTLIIGTEKEPWDVFDEAARNRIPRASDSVGSAGAAGQRATKAVSRSNSD